MKSELKALENLALPILAPSEIPDNFSLERVLPLPDHRVNDGYEFELRCPDGMLTLRAVSNQPELRKARARTIEFETPFFGTCQLECSGAEVTSCWFSEMQSGYPAYQVTASGIEPEAVIEFVRSLDYVRFN